MKAGDMDSASCVQKFACEHGLNPEQVQKLTKALEARCKELTVHDIPAVESSLSLLKEPYRGPSAQEHATLQEKVSEVEFRWRKEEMRRSKAEADARGAENRADAEAAKRAELEASLERMKASSSVASEEVDGLSSMPDLEYSNSGGEASEYIQAMEQQLEILRSQLAAAGVQTVNKVVTLAQAQEHLKAALHQLLTGEDATAEV